MAGLGPVEQIVIGENKSHHGFTDGNPANTDTGIMASLGDDFRFITVDINGFPGCQDRRSRFDDKACDNGLARGNTAKYASRLVRLKFRISVFTRTDLIGIFFAAEFGGAESGADLHALDGIDAHHRGSDILVQLGIDRCSQTRLYSFRDNLDDRPG